MKQTDDWAPNTERLVRSAIKDERYCSFMLDCLHSVQAAWSLDELMLFWSAASESDLTVAQFIQEHLSA